MRLNDFELGEEVLKVNNLIELLRERNEDGIGVKDRGLENVLEIMQDKLQICIGEFMDRAHEEAHAFDLGDTESVLETFDQAINNFAKIPD